MSKIPPFHLDPHEALRNPEGLPILFRRGMYDVIMREKGAVSHHPNVSPPHRDPTYEEFVKAFNIIAKGLTDSHRLKKGTLTLTPSEGKQREEQVRRLRDTKNKLVWIERWAAQIKKANPDRAARSWWADKGRQEPELTSG